MLVFIGDHTGYNQAVRVKSRSQSLRLIGRSDAGISDVTIADSSFSVEQTPHDLLRDAQKYLAVCATLGATIAENNTPERDVNGGPPLDLACRQTRRCCLSRDEIQNTVLPSAENYVYVYAICSRKIARLGKEIFIIYIYIL